MRAHSQPRASAYFLSNSSTIAKDYQWRTRVNSEEKVRILFVQQYHCTSKHIFHSLTTCFLLSVFFFCYFICFIALCLHFVVFCVKFNSDEVQHAEHPILLHTKVTNLSNKEDLHQQHQLELVQHLLWEVLSTVQQDQHHQLAIIKTAIQTIQTL